ncbi:MAG TPA: hypothetical protein DCS11_01900 [Syntrophus sp. (in: bacteria)]|nr:hypothetical protein [Syntrophus sp. (in: bacteria)]
MDEDKIAGQAAESYDAADRPFDFIEAGGATAIVCESDPEKRAKLNAALKSLDYRITEAANAKDALKRMRFHVYDVAVIDERFDAENPDDNAVLKYLAGLNMSIRRQTFVVLVTERFRTLDNMAAFTKSVNMTINATNLDNAATIIKEGVEDNRAFYHIFRESLKKVGRG